MSIANRQSIIEEYSKKYAHDTFWSMIMIDMHAQD